MVTNHPNRLGMIAGFNLSTDSVASYDMIPSPHNKIASLHGPPKWHEEYQPQVSTGVDHGKNIGSHPQPDTLDQQLDGEQSYDYFSYPYASTGDPTASWYHNQIYTQTELRAVPGVPSNPDGGFNGYESDINNGSHQGMHHQISTRLSSQRVSSYQLYHGYKGLEAPQSSQYRFNPAPPSITHSGAEGIHVPSRTLNPPSAPAAMRVENIVASLLDPPARCFGHRGTVTIELPFVFHCLGPGHKDHIEYSREVHRVVLRSTSELRHRGAEMGMPHSYMAWLCGRKGHCNNILRIDGAKLLKAKKSSKT